LTYRESITNEELNALPTGAFEGEIVVVDSDETMKEAYAHLCRQRVIGFDTETRPTFRRGPLNAMALVQLCSATKAYLFRLNRIPLSAKILSILENGRIVKAGASVRDDIRGIQRQCPFTPAGFVDIQSIVPRHGIVDLSVRKVSGIVLGIRVSKAQRLSNWEAQSLTSAQQLYAATDAWSCREIYLRLLKNEQEHR
jgi:ribonuclease D